MRWLLSLLAAACLASPLPAAGPPIYLWHEPEWFDGVQGSFAYWTGTAKPAGAWGIAGPGISPEWTQGGESEWNSLGAAAAETRAECRRDLFVPRAASYRVWVRHVDHRRKKSPFKVLLSSPPKDGQPGKTLAEAELGVRPVVPVNDEYQLYWGFSFGWASFDADLPAGPLRMTLRIDRQGDAWRQVDAVLLTNDRQFVPVGREKPPFGYFATMRLRPPAKAAWRGSGLPEQAFARPKVAGRDFSMWTGIKATPKWWAGQKIDALTLREVFHAHSPPTDIRAAFHKQYPKAEGVPLIGWPNLLPGLYLGESPDLSPETLLRKWLARTKTPFYILTNYASGSYTEKTGPATYAALTGPLAEQFLGYIHGEAIGTGGVTIPDRPFGATRAEQVAGLMPHLKAEQARRWSAIYKTKVAEDHWSKGIPCLSVDSLALAHVFAEMGSRVLGYEEDSTNFHVPMRIAFERGAARQYGGAWINYASGNFGDACNYFTQEPQVPRGAKCWFHSKYAVTDGVTAGWYRKMYYLNYLGGASAIYWEQSLGNQWILPGPGTHPIGLSPFGRATEDFMDFVSRTPDRGEPLTPIAFLLSHAHGYEPVSYRCKMLHHFGQSAADRELRELFNVCWHPAAVAEGKPAAPDVQSLPSGVHGNIFDVLVDRPSRARAIFHYPVIVAAGDVDLGGQWPSVLEEYVSKGGTLVVNVEAARKLPAKLLGLEPAGKTVVAQRWRPAGGKDVEAVPFEVAAVKLAGATVLAEAGEKLPLIARHAVGKGAVLVTLCPRMLGQDERAHPALPYLLNGLTQGLLPVEVLRGDGSPLEGELMYQVNRTRDGYLVLLANNRGVDKTPNGVARVDRRQYVDALVRTRLMVKAAREQTAPAELKAVAGTDGTEARVRVHPGDVQVVALTTTP
jgi:hypothetical protein